VLREVARRGAGRFEIVIAGFCMDPADLPRQAAGEPYVSFQGPYRSPQDLPALYESVDMVWACYPGRDDNDPDWRWAQAICRSNRFYESCFFRRPLVTLAESADGQEVERLGIGLALRERSAGAVWDRLNRVTDLELGAWRDRLLELPQSVSVYTDEPERLRVSLLDVMRPT
jgi:succinoglycan biosynthesis protein ExoL